MKKVRKFPLFLYSLLILIGCFMIYRNYLYLLCYFQPGKSLQQVYQGDLNIGDHVSGEINHTYGCFVTNEKAFHMEKDSFELKLPLSEDYYYLQYYSVTEDSKMVAIDVEKQDTSTMDMIAEGAFSGASVTLHLEVDGLISEMKEAYVPYAKHLLETYYGESKERLDDIQHFYVIKTFDVTKVFVETGVGFALMLLFLVLFIVRLRKISKYKRMKQAGKESVKNGGTKKEMTEKDIFDAAGDPGIPDDMISNAGENDDAEENITEEENDTAGEYNAAEGNDIEDEYNATEGNDSADENDIKNDVDNNIDEKWKDDDSIVADDENEMENKAFESEKKSVNESGDSESELVNENVESESDPEEDCVSEEEAVEEEVSEDCVSEEDAVEEEAAVGNVMSERLENNQIEVETTVGNYQEADRMETEIQEFEETFDDNPFHMKFAFEDIPEEKADFSFEKIEDTSAGYDMTESEFSQKNYDIEVDEQDDFVIVSLDDE